MYNLRSGIYLSYESKMPDRLNMIKTSLLEGPAVII